MGSQCCKCASEKNKKAIASASSTSSRGTRGGASVEGDRFLAEGSGLRIRGVRKEDAGLYRARAINAGGEGSVDFQLDIYPAPGDVPQFLRRLSDLAVKVGTRTRLLVEIRSATDVKSAWLRDGREITQNDRLHFLNEGTFFCLDVAPVTLDDSGEWTCIAQNVEGRSSCSCHLNVLVPKAYKKPHFVEELRAVLTSGGTVSLECKVIGVPTPQLRWFKDGEEIKAGDVFALSADPEDPTTLGTYTCEASNCMGKALSSSRVHVVPSGKEPDQKSLLPAGPVPKFTQDLHNEKVKIGGSLILECKVEVPPWPKEITWFNSQGAVTEGSRYHVMADGVGGYSVAVHPAEATDQGQWKCVATGPSGLKSITACNVSMTFPKNYRAPRFLEALRAVLTDEGLVSFECKVVGFPTPQLQWFKDGQELKPGDVYQLTGSSSLGSYCCIARNCMGEAKSTAELTVEDIQNQLTEEEKIQLAAVNQPPRFQVGLKSSQAEINLPFRFTVQVTVNPEPVVTWYRDDEEIQGNERFSFLKEAHGFCHLSLQRLEFADQAEWKCVATNDYGQSVTSCFLKLNIPRHFKKPRFLECLRAVLSEEGAVNLECKVIGVPQPTLRWYKDGKELCPGDIHKIISGEDGTCCLGVYTCEAHNCMGTVSSSASLLGFEQKPPDRAAAAEQSVAAAAAIALSRQPSLSTIQEERTSQLQSITLDDRQEVSFSFDGKEVSVSLYETPDLTEEEALQVVEMYAEELSEHVSEHNVVELPPMRFVKETSTSGHILMEAVVIDVSPDFYASAEDDLRTDADLEEFSISEEPLLLAPNLLMHDDVLPFDLINSDFLERALVPTIPYDEVERQSSPAKPKRKSKESSSSGSKGKQLEDDSSSPYSDALASEKESKSQKDSFVSAAGSPESDFSVKRIKAEKETKSGPIVPEKTTTSTTKAAEQETAQRKRSKSRSASKERSSKEKLPAVLRRSLSKDKSDRETAKDRSSDDSSKGETKKKKRVQKHVRRKSKSVDSEVEDDSLQEFERRKVLDSNLKADVESDQLTSPETQKKERKVKSTDSEREDDSLIEFENRKSSSLKEQLSEKRKAREQSQKRTLKKRGSTDSSSKEDDSLVEYEKRKTLSLGADDKSAGSGKAGRTKKGALAKKGSSESSDREDDGQKGETTTTEKRRKKKGAKQPVFSAAPAKEPTPETGVEVVQSSETDSVGRAFDAHMRGRDALSDMDSVRTKEEDDDEETAEFDTAEDSAYDKSEMSVLESLTQSLQEIQRGLAMVGERIISSSSEEPESAKSSLSVLESLVQPINDIQRGIEAVEKQIIDESQSGDYSPSKAGITILETLAQPVQEFERSLALVEQHSLLEGFEESLFDKTNQSILETVAQPLQEFHRDIALIQQQAVMEATDDTYSDIIQSFKPPLMEVQGGVLQSEKDLTSKVEELSEMTTVFQSTYAQSVEELQKGLAQIVEQHVYDSANKQDDDFLPLTVREIEEDLLENESFIRELKEIEVNVKSYTEIYFEKLENYRAVINEKLCKAKDDELRDVLQSVCLLVAPLNNLQNITNKCITMVAENPACLQWDIRISKENIIQSLTRPLEVLNSTVDLLGKIAHSDSDKEARGISIASLFKLSVPMDELKTTIKLVENLSPHTAIEFLSPPVENVLSALSTVDQELSKAEFIDDIPVDGGNVIKGLDDSLDVMVNCINSIEKYYPDIIGAHKEGNVTSLSSLIKPLEDFQKHLHLLERYILDESRIKDMNAMKIYHIAQDLGKPLQAIRIELSIIKHQIELEEYSSFTLQPSAIVPEGNPLMLKLLEPVETMQKSVTCFYESVISKTPDEPIHLRYVLHALGSLTQPVNALCSTIMKTEEQLLQDVPSVSEPSLGLRIVTQSVSELRQSIESIKNQSHEILLQPELLIISDILSTLSGPLSEVEEGLNSISDQVHEEDKTTLNINLLKTMAEPFKVLQKALIEINNELSSENISEAVVFELKQPIQELQRSILVIQDQVSFEYGDEPTTIESNIVTLQSLIQPMKTLRKHFINVQKVIAEENKSVEIQVAQKVVDISKVLHKLQLKVSSLMVQQSYFRVSKHSGRLELFPILQHMVQFISDFERALNHTVQYIERAHRLDVVKLKEKLLNNIQYFKMDMLNLHKKLYSLKDLSPSDSESTDILTKAIQEFTTALGDECTMLAETTDDEAAALNCLENHFESFVEHINVLHSKLLKVETIITSFASDKDNKKRLKQKIKFVDQSSKKVNTLDVSVNALQSKLCTMMDIAEHNIENESAGLAIQIIENMLSCSNAIKGNLKTLKTETELINLKESDEHSNRAVEELRDCMSLLTSELNQASDIFTESSVQSLSTTVENVTACQIDVSNKIECIVNPEKLEEIIKLEEYVEEISKKDEIIGNINIVKENIKQKLVSITEIQSGPLKAISSAPLQSLTAVLTELTTNIFSSEDKSGLINDKQVIENVKIMDEMSTNLSKMEEQLKEDKSLESDSKQVIVEAVQNLQKAVVSVKGDVKENQSILAIDKILKPLSELNEVIAGPDESILQESTQSIITEDASEVETLKETSLRILEEFAKASTELELGLMKVEHNLLNISEFKIKSSSSSNVVEPLVQPILQLSEKMALVEEMTSDVAMEEQLSSLSMLKTLAQPIKEIQKNILQIQEQSAFESTGKQEAGEKILQAIAKPIRELRTGVALIQEQAMVMEADAITISEPTKDYSPEAFATPLEELKLVLTSIVNQQALVFEPSAESIMDEKCISELQTIATPIRELQKQLAAIETQQILEGGIEDASVKDAIFAIAKPIMELQHSIATINQFAFESSGEEIPSEKISVLKTLAKSLYEVSRGIACISEQQILDDVRSDTTMSDLPTLASPTDFSLATGLEIHEALVLECDSSLQLEKTEKGKVEKTLQEGVGMTITIEQQQVMEARGDSISETLDNLQLKAQTLTSELGAAIVVTPQPVVFESETVMSELELKPEEATRKQVVLEQGSAVQLETQVLESTGEALVTQIAREESAVVKESSLKDIAIVEEQKSLSQVESFSESEYNISKGECIQSTVEAVINEEHIIFTDTERLESLDTTTKAEETISALGVAGQIEDSYHQEVETLSEVDTISTSVSVATECDVTPRGTASAEPAVLVMEAEVLPTVKEAKKEQDLETGENEAPVIEKESSLESKKEPATQTKTVQELEKEQALEMKKDAALEKEENIVTETNTDQAITKKEEQDLERKEEEAKVEKAREQTKTKEDQALQKETAKEEQILDTKKEKTPETKIEQDLVAQKEAYEKEKEDLEKMTEQTLKTKKGNDIEMQIGDKIDNGKQPISEIDSNKQITEINEPIRDVSNEEIQEPKKEKVESEEDKKEMTEKKFRKDNDESLEENKVNIESPEIQVEKRVRVAQNESVTEESAGSFEEIYEQSKAETHIVQDDTIKANISEMNETFVEVRKTTSIETQEESTSSVLETAETESVDNSLKAYQTKDDVEEEEENESVKSDESVKLDAYVSSEIEMVKSKMEEVRKMLRAEKTETLKEEVKPKETSEMKKDRTKLKDEKQAEIEKNSEDQCQQESTTQIEHTQISKEENVNSKEHIAIKEENLDSQIELMKIDDDKFTATDLVEHEKVEIKPIEESKLSETSFAIEVQKDIREELKKQPLGEANIIDTVEPSSSVSFDKEEKKELKIGNIGETLEEVVKANVSAMGEHISVLLEKETTTEELKLGEREEKITKVDKDIPIIADKPAGSSIELETKQEKSEKVIQQKAEIKKKEDELILKKDVEIKSDTSDNLAKEIKTKEIKTELSSTETNIEIREDEVGKHKADSQIKLKVEDLKKKKPEDKSIKTEDISQTQTKQTKDKREENCKAIDKPALEDKTLEKKPDRKTEIINEVTDKPNEEKQLTKISKQETSMTEKSVTPKKKSEKQDQPKEMLIEKTAIEIEELEHDLLETKISKYDSSKNMQGAQQVSTEIKIVEGRVEIQGEPIKDMKEMQDESVKKLGTTHIEEEDKTETKNDKVTERNVEENVKSVKKKVSKQIENKEQYETNKEELKQVETKMENKDSKTKEVVEIVKNVELKETSLDKKHDRKEEIQDEPMTDKMEAQKSVKKIETIQKEEKVETETKSDEVIETKKNIKEEENVKSVEKKESKHISKKEKSEKSIKGLEKDETKQENEESKSKDVHEIVETVEKDMATSLTEKVEPKREIREEAIKHEKEVQEEAMKKITTQEKEEVKTDTTNDEVKETKIEIKEDENVKSVEKKESKHIAKKEKPEKSKTELEKGETKQEHRESKSKDVHEIVEKDKETPLTKKVQDKEKVQEVPIKSVKEVQEESGKKITMQVKEEVKTETKNDEVKETKIEIKEDENVKSVEKKESKHIAKKEKPEKSKKDLEKDGTKQEHSESKSKDVHEIVKTADKEEGTTLTKTVEPKGEIQEETIKDMNKVQEESMKMISTQEKEEVKTETTDEVIETKRNIKEDKNVKSVEKKESKHTAKKEKSEKSKTELEKDETKQEHRESKSKDVHEIVEKDKETQLTKKVQNKEKVQEVPIQDVKEVQEESVKKITMQVKEEVKTETKNDEVKETKNDLKVDEKVKLVEKKESKYVEKKEQSEIFKKDETKEEITVAIKDGTHDATVMIGHDESVTKLETTQTDTEVNTETKNEEDKNIKVDEKVKSVKKIESKHVEKKEEPGLIKKELEKDVTKKEIEGEIRLNPDESLKKLKTIQKEEGLKTEIRSDEVEGANNNTGTNEKKKSVKDKAAKHVEKNEQCETITKEIVKEETNLENRETKSKDELHISKIVDKDTIKSKVEEPKQCIEEGKLESQTDQKKSEIKLQPKSDENAEKKEQSNILETEVKKDEVQEIKHENDIKISEFRTVETDEKNKTKVVEEIKTDVRLKEQDQKSRTEKQKLAHKSETEVKEISKITGNSEKEGVQISKDETTEFETEKITKEMKDVEVENKEESIKKIEQKEDESSLLMKTRNDEQKVMKDEKESADTKDQQSIEKREQKSPEKKDSKKAKSKKVEDRKKILKQEEFKEESTNLVEKSERQNYVNEKEEIETMTKEQLKEDRNVETSHTDNLKLERKVEESRPNEMAALDEKETISLKSKSMKEKKETSKYSAETHKPDVKGETKLEKDNEMNGSEKIIGKSKLEEKVQEKSKLKHDHISKETESSSLMLSEESTKYRETFVDEKSEAKVSRRNRFVDESKSDDIKKSFHFSEQVGDQKIKGNEREELADRKVRSKSQEHRFWVGSAGEPKYRLDDSSKDSSSEKAPPRQTWTRRESKCKPYFCGRLVDRTAAQGSRVKMSCSFVGSPEPNVSWLKDGLPLLHGASDPLAGRCETKISNGVATIEIYSASPSDCGRYSCVASNAFGQATSTATLRVFAQFEPTPTPPTFTRRIQDKYRFSTDELILECRVQAQPPPKVTWLKDGSELAARGRYQQTEMLDGTCRLVVSGPEPQDSGCYACRAENTVWSEQISDVVTFEGRANYSAASDRETSRYTDSRRPFIANLLGDHTVPVGGTLALHVQLKGRTPGSQVTWFRGTEPVTKLCRRAKYFEEDDTYSLVLPDVKAQEAGLYLCRVSNAYGHSDTCANVQVITVGANGHLRGKPAMFLNRPDTAIHVAHGEDISVSFRLTGDPKPRVTWMKGLKDMTNNPRSMKETVDDCVRLTLKRASIYDSGTYFIVAKNIYGCDRAFFNVQVRQRARSLTPVSSYGAVDTDTILRDIHEIAQASLNDVPGPVSSEPVVTDGGRTWLTLTWAKPTHRGAAPVVAYKVEAWEVGEGGGARWAELGVTPINTFDAFELRAGAAYKFRVTARNRYGWGEPVVTRDSVTAGCDQLMPEIVTDLPGSLKALVSTNLTLQCEVKGEPTPDIRWYHDGREVAVARRASDRLLVSNKGGLCSLMIRDLQAEDSGRYVCEATNKLGRASTFARLLVVQDAKLLKAAHLLKRVQEDELTTLESPPQFTLRLRDRRVQVSYPVRLTCQVVGYPVPALTWIKDGDEIKQDDRHSFWSDDNFQTLEISRSRLEDAGEYAAVARNEHGSVSCGCRLVVDRGVRDYVAPGFVVGVERHATVKEGAVLRLRATVEAYPSVDITWHRDGTRLRQSRRLVCTLDREGHIEFTLADVSRRDAGTYTCTATNEVGRTETCCEVTVTSRLGGAGDVHQSETPDGLPYTKVPMFITKPRSTNAVEGETVVIVCEVVGDPEPEVVCLRDWLKPGYYRDGPQFKGSRQGHQYRLEIPQVKLDFTGTYAIIARNEHGEARAIVSLQIFARGQGREGDMNSGAVKQGKVQTLPEVRRELKDMRCCDGDSVTLECQVFAVPPPDIRWLKDGKILPMGGDVSCDADDESARLTISKVYPEDEGEYTCMAYNELGRALTSACLIVDVPEEKETMVTRQLSKPPGFLSTPSTPRTTPSRSISPGVQITRDFTTPSGINRTRIRRPKLCSPKFYAVPHNRVAEEGETVKFQCSVAGHPIPWASWDKDGNIVTPTARLTVLEQDDLRILQIKEVTPEDAGLYRVTLENDYGSVEATARLEVICHRGTKTRGVRAWSASRASPTFGRRLVGSASRVGGTFTLACDVQASPSPVITWSRNGEVVLRSERIQPLWDGRTARLKLKNLELEDAGVYTCVAENELGTTRCSAELLVLGNDDPSDADLRPPVFLTGLPEITSTTEGKQLELQVKLQGTLPLEVVWLKDKAELPDCMDFRYVDYGDGRFGLRIADVFIADGGIYSCEAFNKHGDAVTSGRLEVTEPVELTESKKKQLFFTKTPIPLEVEPGSSASFCARIQSPDETDVHIAWSVAGKPSEQSGRFRVHKDGDSTVLRIDPVKLEDIGPVNCRAHICNEGHKEAAHGCNKCYVVSCTSRLAAAPGTEGWPAQLLHGPADTTALRGQKVVLQAAFSGSPQPTVRWLKAGRELTSEGCMKIVKEDGLSSLILDPVSADDSGKYVVSVENCHGADCHFASVAVEGPPDPPAGLPSVSTMEDTVTLAWSSPPYDGGCMVTGYRVEMKKLPQTAWIVVTDRCHSLSYVVRGLTPGQEYAFRVRAENVHGASQASAETPVVVIGTRWSSGSEDEVCDIMDWKKVQVEPGESFTSRFEIMEELGKGRYGVVHKVVDKKSSQKMAAKFVRCIKKQDKQKVFEEIEIMNCLRHPKLLQLAAAYDTAREIVMVMEYITGGELFERVVADDFTLTERDCILFMRQICEGVDYMHQNNVVHLDLKPENIMCYTRTSHQIKVIDFGLAQKLSPDITLRVLFGTPEFIPPEIINYEPIGVESDMWSLGVICYVLLSGLSPFMGDTDAETFANITRADYDFDDEAFDAISQDAKDFISNLLIKRKEKRFSASQCLQHKWMTQCDTNMNCVKLSTDKLKKFIIRRKWQKTGNAIRALGRMATLSAASRRNSASSSSSSPRPSLSSGAVPRMSSLNEEEQHHHVSISETPQLHSMECIANGKHGRVRVCSERSDSGISDCSSINVPISHCCQPLLNKEFSISEENETCENTNNTSRDKQTKLFDLKTRLNSNSNITSNKLRNVNNNSSGFVRSSKINSADSSSDNSNLSAITAAKKTNLVRSSPFLNNSFVDGSSSFKSKDSDVFSATKQVTANSVKPHQPHGLNSTRATSPALQKDAKVLEKSENFQKAFAFWKR